MSKSKAKKRREKQQRETGFNVSQKRGNWNGVNPVEKKTPTLRERLRKWRKKHKKRQEGDV